MQFLLKGSPTLNAAVAAFVAVAMLTLLASISEPIVAHGDQQFTVTQEIASEIAFLTDPNDVVMDTTLSGLTGDSSLGTTTFNVSTNNATGYYVELAFSSSTAMNSTSSYAAIDNYLPAGDPNGDWDMSVSAGEGFFAYTVYNETTPGDADATFLGNGTNSCTTGSTATMQHCWFNKSDATVAERIIDANSPTVGTGATSSITFRVELGTNSGVETGWYVATGTLTATTKAP